MYFQDYFGFMIALLICMAFSAIASSRVNSTFKKYDKIRARSGMTGAATVRALMDANGVRGIGIGQTGGTLTDHYNPKKAVINLSDATYHSSSIAAIAVAAHEMGHVMQKQEAYGLYQIRTALVPVVNIGSFMAWPLVLAGMLLDTFVTFGNSDLGFFLAMIGVALYGSSLLFALVTLPVELNASRRAKQMLLQQNILTEEELPGAQKVLSAAALTYLASLVTSAVYFLRFLMYVMSIFGRRRN